MLKMMKENNERKYGNAQDIPDSLFFL